MWAVVGSRAVGSEVGDVEVGRDRDVGRGSFWSLRIGPDLRRALAVIALILVGPYFLGRLLFSAVLVWSGGVTATECGFVADDRASRVDVVGCAQHHLDRGEPFRVAFKLHGIDSLVVEGIAQSRKGDARLVVFDTRMAIGPWFQVRTQLCDGRPRVSANRRDPVIMCESYR